MPECLEGSGLEVQFHLAERRCQGRTPPPGEALCVVTGLCVVGASCGEDLRRTEL